MHARFTGRREETVAQMTDPTTQPSKRPKWLRWLALIFLTIPMFPFIAYRGIKMVNAQDSDDPEDLIKEIHKMNRLSWVFRGKQPRIRLEDRAKIAEQWVLQSRLKEAQQEFSEIRSKLTGEHEERKRYLRHYCSYWLANIRGDIEQAQYEVRQASKLSYRSVFLGLPEPKGKDGLDLALDHELIEAAENAGMSVEEFVRQQVPK